MEFSDKLNYLFELTQAEGKDLAAALYITPPGVSKMRKGVRGLPRKREVAYSIALFFAQRCKSAEQREALAKKMRAAQVISADDDALADVLLSWFTNDTLLDNRAEKGTEAFLHRLVLSANTTSSRGSDATQPLQSAGDNIFAYYGVEGKRAAYMQFLQCLQKKGEAFDICILSDEDNAWIDEDAFFANKYYDQLLRLVDQGCFFRRIVGQLNDLEQAFSSINRWFPLYLTGKAVSFYYKRMRDDLNRITIFAVSGVAALYSFSVGTTLDKDCVTFFTKDERTVSSMLSLFNKYLAMCDPATKTFGADTSEVQMHERLLEYESHAGTCLQLSTSLSFITLPWEIAVSLRTSKHETTKDVFLVSFAKRYKAFKKNLEQYDFFDFIQLANVDDAISGGVAIPAANILGEDTQYYSAQGYLQHLQRIEYLIKHYRHYHIVINEPNISEKPIIYVKEGYAVLITRASNPFIIFDVSQHNLINAFTENMYRRVPEDVYETGYRKKTLKAIQACIQQIEERLASEQSDASGGTATSI